MKKLIQKGDRITWTNDTGSDVAAGSPVVIGSIVGVACVAIASLAAGAVAVEGVFELPKVAGADSHAIAQGEALIFDTSVGKFDTSASVAEEGDLVGGCVAWGSALTTATTVLVKINAGVSAIEPAAG